jgi:competence protein ComEA
MIAKHTKLLNVFVYLFVFALALAIQTTTPARAAEVVDINRADAETMIANWKGIGEKKARAIISYRKKNGPFKSIDDLLNVKGIGEGLIKKNKRYMSLSGGARSTAKTTPKSTKKTSKKKTDKKKSTSSKKKSSTDTKKKDKSKKKPTKKSSTKKSSKKKNSTT